MTVNDNYEMGFCQLQKLRQAASEALSRRQFLVVSLARRPHQLVYLALADAGATDRHQTSGDLNATASPMATHPHTHNVTFTFGQATDWIAAAHVVYLR